MTEGRGHLDMGGFVTPHTPQPCFISATFSPACQVILRNTHELILIVVLAGHEDGLLRRPLLTLQPVLANPVPPLVLIALADGALLLVALIDRDPRRLPQRGVGFELLVERLVGDLRQLRRGARDRWRGGESGGGADGGRGGEQG